MIHLSRVRQRAWPCDNPPAAPYVSVGEMLTREYGWDAHFTSYESSVQCRMKGEALGKADIVMHLMTVDVDGPKDPNSTRHIRTPEWDAGMHSAILRLMASHRGYAYWTRGGLRLLWGIVPVPLRSVSDALRWRQVYLDRLEWLKGWGIEGDPACQDWTRLMRAPHALRDGAYECENYPTMGDPYNLGVWDWEVPEVQRLPPPRSPGRVAIAAACGVRVGGGILAELFAGRGWLGREVKPGVVSVRCPWESDHSGHRDDTSTAIVGEKFMCMHAHCMYRNVLTVFTEAEIDAARARCAGSIVSSASAEESDVGELDASVYAKLVGHERGLMLINMPLGVGKSRTMGRAAAAVGDVGILVPTYALGRETADIVRGFGGSVRTVSSRFARCQRKAEAEVWAKAGVRRSLYMCGDPERADWGVCPYWDTCEARGTQSGGGVVITAHANAPAVVDDVPRLWIDEAPAMYGMVPLGPTEIDGTVSKMGAAAGCLREVVCGRITRGLAVSQARLVRPLVALFLRAYDVAERGVYSVRDFLRLGSDAALDHFLLDADPSLCRDGVDVVEAAIGLADRSAFTVGLSPDKSILNKLWDKGSSDARRLNIASDFASMCHGLTALLECVWQDGQIGLEIPRVANLMWRSSVMAKVMAHPCVVIADATGDSTRAAIETSLGHPIDEVKCDAKERRQVGRVWFTEPTSKSALGDVSAADAVLDVVARVEAALGMVSPWCLITYKYVAEELIRRGWSAGDLMWFGGVRGLNREPDEGWRRLITVGDPNLTPGMAELVDKVLGIGHSDTMVRDELAQAHGRMRAYWGSKVGRPAVSVHVGNQRPGGARWDKVIPVPLPRLCMTTEDVRALVRTCVSNVGGRKQLAQALNVPVSAVTRWGGGTLAPSDETVNIMLEIQKMYG